MTGRDNSDERDLLAWVDGQLDHDPAFKAAFEERMRRSPALAERARAYAAQNAALRAALDDRLTAPVPPRLLDALERKPRTPMWPTLRVAALAVVMVCVGAVGWVLGERSDDDFPADALLDRSLDDFAVRQPARPSSTSIEDALAAGRPLGWLHDEVEILIRAPDLSALGYVLVDRKVVRHGTDERVVRLDYAAADRTTFSLFLTPRWDNRPGPILGGERNGVASAFWIDGPLATTVLSHLPVDETVRIAEATREAMQVENARTAVVWAGMHEPWRERPSSRASPPADGRDPTAAPAPR